MSMIREVLAEQFGVQVMSGGVATAAIVTSGAALSPTAAQPTYNQAVLAADWPQRASLRLLHELWHDGKCTKRYAPYRLAQTSHFDKATRKLVSYARQCVLLIDHHLPVPINTYMSLSHSQRDTAMLTALTALRNALKDAQHPAESTALYTKLLNSDKYNSLYENDFKYIRKQRGTIEEDK